MNDDDISGERKKNGGGTLHSDLKCIYEILRRNFWIMEMCKFEIDEEINKIRK